jgi:hypothetical protein
MIHHLLLFAESVAATTILVTAIAAFLSTAGSLGPAGRRFVDLSTRAPLLDFWVAAMTWLPWIIAAVIWGWAGLIGSVLGEMIALGLWCMGHEMAHREAARGPRIVKFINRTVGRWQNHLALWVTLIALPGFWFIRVLEVVSYWPLVVLLGFPKYKQSEWINVSRQKFSGLVGHDLVWCLYCDWMTGVYSLGAEMLRNVESFWCPIRFYDGKKCANCRTDFPDIEHGWVAPTGTMADVEKTMEAMYGQGRREWFGHPARLTVNGVDPEGRAAGSGHADSSI